MPQKKRPKTDLEIVVVNYNTEFWLKKTLTTLKDNYINRTKKKIKVTVVDNNSDDNSVSIIRKEYSWVKLITLPENQGFAAANNRALSESTARYVMLLNSDVEFTHNSDLDILIRFLDTHTNIGAITPKIVFVDGNLDPASHRGDPTPWVAFTYFSGLASLFPKTKLFGEYHQTYKDLSTIHAVDACSGAAMIVRRSLIEKIGLLDDRFFMYAEDLDWCKRIRDAGNMIAFHPSVTVIHHKYKSGLKSSSQAIAKKTRLHFYNTMLQYYDKHYRPHYPELLRTLIKYFIVYKKGAL